MDYKKKYETALERAKEIYMGSYKPEVALTIAETFIKVFPELKESEDEKIRKELINYFTEGREFLSLCSFGKDEIITWLEKQDNKPKQTSIWKHWKDGIAGNGEGEPIYLVKNGNTYSLNSCLGFECDYIELLELDNLMLEKQVSEPNWCYHKVDLSNSSEEYRKAYYDGWNNCNMQHAQCQAESNDVIKCLINGMRFYYEDNEEATWGTEKFSMKVKDILSWLEKQGIPAKLSEEEQNRFAKGVLSSCALSFIKYLEAHKYEGKMCVSNGECEDIENAFQNAMWDRLHRYYCKYIERQGNKPQGKTALEAAKEEKADNSNKVKSRFHEGDFIRHNKANIIYKVISANGGFYYIENIKTSVRIGLFNVEQNFHLWTIADAKEGDVLYLQKDGKEHIIIYKGVIKERFRTFVSAYCAYNSIVDDFCFADVSRYADIAYGGIMPATKEQHNTLMKAMADAGYTFDFEKKELKKIETVDIPFSTKDSELIETTYFIPKGFHAEIEDDKVIIKKGKQKPTDTYCKENCKGYQETGKCYADGSCDAKIKAEQKPVWSEEDDKLFSLTLDMVEWYSGKNEKNSRTVSDWLKSLKNRIIPQQEE